MDVHACLQVFVKVHLHMCVCVHAWSWIPLYIIIYINNEFHFLNELFCYLSFPSPETILLPMNTHMKTNRETTYMNKTLYFEEKKTTKLIMNKIPRPSLILISERIFAWFRWNCNKKQTFKEFLSSINMVCGTRPSPLPPN